MTTVKRKVDRLQKEEEGAILPHILQAYKHAKSEIRIGENPVRSLIRFSFALTNSLLSKIDGESYAKKHKIEIKNENESMSYDMAHNEIEQEIEEQDEDQQTEQSMVISSKIVDHCAQEVETSLTAKTLTISQSSGLTGVKRRRGETKLVNQQQQFSADTPSQVTSSFSSSNQNYHMQTPSAPKTKDLVVKAVESLPNQIGTKEEIIEMIDVLCPTFCLPKVGAFKRTFDQALSKYLLANDAQIMLIASQYDINREMCQKGGGAGGD